MKTGGLVQYIFFFEEEMGLYFKSGPKVVEFAKIKKGES